MQVASVVFHFFQLVCICGSYEVALHVIYVAFGVHEVLLIFSFDLNPSHNHIVLDVHAFFLLLIFDATEDHLLASRNHI